MGIYRIDNIFHLCIYYCNGKWKFIFLYFVIDFLTGNNRDFILFCHTMAEKLTNVKKLHFSTCFAQKQVEKYFFHLFCPKTSGKIFFPLVFLTFVNFSAIVWQKSMKSPL